MDINIDVNDIKTCDDVDEGNNNSLTSSSSYLNGRWSYDEHIRFLKGCLLFGNNWKKVENYVKSRTSSQIRSHAQKFLIKLNDAEEILTKYKIKIIQDYEGTLWKGAEIDNSSDLMMLALDSNYVVTAYYSTDMFKAVMKPGTLMVTVQKKIEHKHEDGQESSETIINKIKKLFKFIN